MRDQSVILLSCLLKTKPFPKLCLHHLVFSLSLSSTTIFSPLHPRLNQVHPKSRPTPPILHLRVKTTYIMATGAVTQRACLGVACTNVEVSLKCPTCLKLGKESYFCSQECFKNSWVCHLLSPIFICSPHQHSPTSFYQDHLFLTHTRTAQFPLLPPISQNLETQTRLIPISSPRNYHPLPHKTITNTRPLFAHHHSVRTQSPPQATK